MSNGEPQFNEKTNSEIKIEKFITHPGGSRGHA